MCGCIAGYVGKPSKVKATTKKIYEAQKSRGTEGFGLAIRKSDGTLHRHRTEDEAPIFKSPLWGMLERGDYFLFHHRMPTSTFNTPECNHPIANEDCTIMMIHNGTISKFKLKEEHVFETAINITYTTKSGLVIAESSDFTDSEVAIHFLEERVRVREGIMDVLKDVHEQYSSTFLYLASWFDGIMFSAQFNPLYAYKLNGNMFLASQRTACDSFKNTEDCEPAVGYIHGSDLHITKMSHTHKVAQTTCQSVYAITKEEEETRDNDGPNTWFEYLGMIAKDRVPHSNHTTLPTVHDSPKALVVPTSVLDKRKHGNRFCMIHPETGEVVASWPNTDIGYPFTQSEWDEQLEIRSLSGYTRFQHSRWFPRCDTECIGCQSFECPLNSVFLETAYGPRHQLGWLYNKSTYTHGKTKPYYSIAAGMGDEA